MTPLLDGRSPRPPRPAQWALRLAAPRRIHEELAGDLHEVFLTRAERHGLRTARRWYWGQVARAFLDARSARRPVIHTRIAGDPFMQTLTQDIRYAVRLLAKQPAFTAVAVLMLALGIGANATVFSWVNSVLLDPLPGAARSEELVQPAFTSRSTPLTSFSYPDYRDFRDSTKSLSGLAGRDDLAVGIVIDREAERAWAELVSANFFDVLEAPAWRGRVLQPSDDAPGAEPVVVISHGYWLSRFGGDAQAIGRRVSINAQPFTIVGVARPGFQGGESGLQFDMWLPVGTQPLVNPGGRLEVRGSRWLTLIGRRAPGVSVEQVRAELDAFVTQLRGRYPGYDDYGAAAFPLAESPTGGVSVLRPVLLILMMVAGIVLLIACANLAGLLLARASARQREMAIRLSIGAGRGRLVQQLLIEGTLLGLTGALGALVALRWTSGLLMGFAPPSELPIHLAVAIDGRVLAFTATIAISTVLLFALVPALQATMSDLMVNLRDGAGTGRTFARNRLRRGLVAAQVALAMTLLIGAGLCLRSLSASNAMTPGFTAEGIVVGWLDLVPAGHTPDSGRAFYARLLDRVRAIPGVESATLARRIPLGFMGGSFSNVTVEGYAPPSDQPLIVGVNYVGPDYAKTMRMPIAGGRDLAVGDVAGQPRVAIINETMAKQYWADRDPIGGRFMFGRLSAENTAWITVVGVARDIKQRSMNERPQPFVFLSALQSYVPSVVLHARVAGDPAAVSGALPRIVRELDAQVTFYNVGLLADHTRAATFQQRLAANLLVVFGGLALLLAAIGSYGVLSYLVGQRRREIGIRLAIGATRSNVFGLIVTSGARLIGVGTAIGLALSIGVGFSLQSLLIGVRPIDPVTYGTVLMLMGMVALLACVLPARSAAAVDPAMTLRED